MLIFTVTINRNCMHVCLFVCGDDGVLVCMCRSGCACLYVGVMVCMFVCMWGDCVFVCEDDGVCVFVCRADRVCACM